MKNITIIGAGSFGVSLAVLLSNKGYKVKIWTNSKEEESMLNLEKEHKTKLPGVKIPDDVICYTDTEKAFYESNVFVFAVPSNVMRTVSKNLSKYIPKNSIVISVAKGIEAGTLKRMSEVIEDEIKDVNIAVLSGPSHAEEVGKFIPTTIVVSAKDKKIACEVQDIFMTDKLRVYTNSDLIGVEIGGALKNVIALCAGITDGLGCGDNTKAALMSRGLSEITRLGVKMGAKAETFSGLTCMGDLIVTCLSMHSRNRKAGILIGKGYTVDEAISEVKMVVEGVPNTKSGYELGQKYNVELPIINEAYDIIFNQKPANEAITRLMTREKKEEMF